MICEVELLRDVPVLAGNLDRNGLIPQRSIVNRLLEDLFIEKSSRDHGYFLAVTGLKKIGKGEAVDESGDAFFPVVFNCRTFLPCSGEVLQGFVHHVSTSGVFLRCGPIKYIFLSPRKMPNYHYVPGEKPAFVSDELAKIESGVVVQFVVLAVKWIEKKGTNIRRDFVMLASIEGNSLGPVSLSGSDELELGMVV
ncbi:hypothetical protein SLEP1_g454 [Rubroshorea leprosula]|uniref:DNA-directed RNA polymerase subunit n=1 Tax=Rubroshorea leprosula TaxID=152421 RepID=A0AAV5HAG4_9ROSI|nr:hypothetical protein SLEP1_g454 [Rubroshorea leprosula]